MTTQLPEAGGARYAAEDGGKSHSKFLEKVLTFEVERFAHQLLSIEVTAPSP